MDAQRSCPDCGKALPHKGQHQSTFHTLFGNLEVQSPAYFIVPASPRDSIVQPTGGIVHGGHSPGTPLCGNQVGLTDLV